MKSLGNFHSMNFPLQHRLRISFDLVSGLAHLECDSRSGKLMMHCQDWWVEDLSVLKIDLYQRVIAAMRRAGDYVYS